MKVSDGLFPELKTGDRFVSKKGIVFSIRRVRKPTRDTGFDEPLYRIVYPTIVGNSEWTREEIQESGAKMII